MKPFLLTYQRAESPIDISINIEGIQFSSGLVVLEWYPDDEWHGTREFYNLEHALFKLNEFGDTSIKWLDEVSA